MTDEKALVPAESLQLGVLTIAPSALVERATAVASELAKVVDDRKLYTIIRQKKFVHVEGWNALGAMLGIVPRECNVVEHETGDFEATVELVRVSDGAIIGCGSAIVGMDEKMWATRPRYARRSMAITRATGKAFRLGFSWIMSLAGYEPTPAEEMDGVIEGEVKDTKPSKPIAKNQTQSNKKSGNGGVSPLVQALIDAKVSSTVASAAGVLNYLDMPKDATTEDYVAKGKIYRAWRDSGRDAPEAAELTNSGEVPK